MSPSAGRPGAATPSPPDGRPHGDRRASPGPTRRPWALVAAAALVVAVVTVVLVFGVHRPPALEHVADPGPRPSAAVALTESDGQGSCLRVALRDGTSTQPWCDPTGGEVVAWPEGGPVLVRLYGPTMRLVEVDPREGIVVDTHPDDGQGSSGGADAGVSSYRDGDDLVVVRDRTELWRTPAPPGYEARWSADSPDGAWVAWSDTAGRLLVSPSDGSAPPRVWLEQARSWGNLVWEGTDTTS